MDKCFKNENLKFVNNPYKLKLPTVLNQLKTNTQGENKMKRKEEIKIGQHT